MQVENKWKSLERAYKAKLLHNKKSGRGKRHCPYEKELEAILVKRHSIIPKCVLASTKKLAVDWTPVAGCSSHQEEPSEQPEIEIAPVPSPPPPPVQDVAVRRSSKLILNVLSRNYNNRKICSFYCFAL